MNQDDLFGLKGRSCIDIDDQCLPKCHLCGARFVLAETNPATNAMRIMFQCGSWIEAKDNGGSVTGMYRSEGCFKNRLSRQ